MPAEKGCHDQDRDQAPAELADELDQLEEGNIENMADGLSLVLHFSTFQT